MKHIVKNIGYVVLSIAFSMIAFSPAAFPAIPSAGAEPAYQAEIGRVRFVHIALGTPALDAYVDDRLWAGVSPQEVVNYQDVTAGEHTFSFRLQEASQALTSVVATVNAGQRLTVVAMEGPEGVVARVYVDNVSAPARNAARVTMIHAAPDAGVMTVTIDGATVAEDLEYGESSASSPPPNRGVSQFYDGPHDIALTVDGAAQPVSGAVRTFTGNRNYVFFIAGLVGDYQIVAAESSVLKPESNSLFRFANMARGLGDVTVYINHEDVPIFPQVKFSRITQYYTTGVGPHTVEVYPLGSPRQGAPLARGTAVIGPGEHVVFVMHGGDDEVVIRAHTSNLDPVAAGSARLHVIHAAADNPAFRVETSDGVPLFDPLGLGDSASREIPAGGYGLRLIDAASGETLMEQGGFEVQPGTVTLMIAIDDDPRVPLINAVPLAVEGVPQYAAIRWAHLDAQAGAVDVYLDGTPVIRGLSYKLMIDYQLYQPAFYSLRVFPAGSDPAKTLPLIEGQIDLRRLSHDLFVYETRWDWHGI